MGPTPEERRLHATVHIPARSWCGICMQAKFDDDPHFREGHDREGDEIQMDYCFAGFLCILMLYFVNTMAPHAILGPKGVDYYMIRAVAAAIENWGVTKIVLKHDQEPAITALVREIKNFRKAPTIVEEAQKGNHQGVGGVERANQEVLKQIRALLYTIQENYGRELPNDHSLWPWLVRHSSWLLSRFTVHHDDRTSYEMLRGRPYRGEIVVFGECVWAREPQTTSKLQPRWAKTIHPHSQPD